MKIITQFSVFCSTLTLQCAILVQGYRQFTAICTFFLRVPVSFQWPPWTWACSRVLAVGLQYSHSEEVTSCLPPVDIVSEGLISSRWYSWRGGFWWSAKLLWALEAAARNLVWAPSFGLRQCQSCYWRHLMCWWCHSRRWLSSLSASLLRKAIQQSYWT